MSKLDELIGQALSAEDRELLARHGEPSYITQAFGIFRGPWNWVMWLLNVIGGITFLAAIFAFWQVHQSTETLSAIKWGVAGLVCLQVTIMGKSFMGTHLEANRLLREIKRVELQLSLLRAAS